ncbi:MAG: DUF2605 domain-containing protein [Cyanobacteria bacterium J06555_13]
MSYPSIPPEDTDLLKSILPPLLEDFHHWFGRTIDRLEKQSISFLSEAEQADMLSRVKVAQKQVSASQALASATDSQAGIEMSVVMGWHKLVNECWNLAIRIRQEKQSQPDTYQPDI